MSNSWIGIRDGEALESGLLSKQIEKAQRRVEEYHFDQRKNLLEYDEVMDFSAKRPMGYASPFSMAATRARSSSK